MGMMYRKDIILIFLLVGIPGFMYNSCKNRILNLTNVRKEG